MKRYIKSSYDPWANADLSEWSEQDIQLWEDTDWKRQNYKPLYVYDDSFDGTLYIYGLPGGVRKETVTFVKTIQPNTIYSPLYEVPDWYHSDVYNRYKSEGYIILSPSVERTTHIQDGVKYRVADRSETQELNDALSR